MKAMLLLLLLIFQLTACEPSRQCVCPEGCFKLPQTSITSAVLYDAFKGSAIACSLPIEDRLIAAYNAQRVLKEGQLNRPFMWENPQSSFKGTFELLSLHEEKNTPCFKYTQSIHSPERILIAQGIACQTPYRVWNIVHEIPETDPWVMTNPDKGFSPSIELKMRLSRFVD